MDIIIANAKRLHEEGVIKAKFGKDIPIIIHELEYSDVSIDWTERANPASITIEFIDWIKSL